MIARLTGTLAEIGVDYAVLDVAGVGYLVQASARTLSAIGAVGGTAMLLTEMQVREDSMTLFGFGSAGEREWFRMLTGVQGVGGRVALSILSTLDAGELSRAVAGQDKAMIARANGVGPKLAQRIVLELKDKVGKGLASTSGGAISAEAFAITGSVQQAMAALTGLGYSQSEAALSLAKLDTALPVPELIRLALQGMGKK